MSVATTWRSNAISRVNDLIRTNLKMSDAEISTLTPDQKRKIVREQLVDVHGYRTYSNYKPDFTGIYLEMKNMEAELDKVGQENAIIISDRTNEEMITSKGFHIDVSKTEIINSLLFTKIDGDVIENIPACLCGHLKTEENRNKRCGKCNTLCLSPVDRNIRNTIWFEVPEGVRAALTPVAYKTLEGIFGNFFVYMVNPKVSLDKPTNKRIEKGGLGVQTKQSAVTERKKMKFLALLQEKNWVRGLNHFVANMDEAVYEILLPSGLNHKDTLATFTKVYKSNSVNWTTRWLLMPDRTLFPVEENDKGRWVDNSIYEGLDSFRILQSLYSREAKNPLSEMIREYQEALSKTSYTQKTIASLKKALEREVAKREYEVLMVSEQLGDYIINIVMKNQVGKKPGHARKQVFGSRLDYTARAVVSSINGPHHYREIHLPWGLSVLLFNSHLSNLLLKRGYSPYEIERKLKGIICKHDTVIRELFDELLTTGLHLSDIDHRDVDGAEIVGALESVLQRNPSLLRGSAQNLAITKIKDDLSDVTISLSDQVLKAFNTDFDGDEQNLAVATSGLEVNIISALKPHFGVLDQDRPDTISGIPLPPLTVMSMLFNFIEDFN